ncbi:SCO3242 family prenyltransferase [Streptomyces sp. NPDC055189]
MGGAGAGVGAGGGGGGGLRLGTGRDWAELLRVSALFTVPGDALAGAAATGLHPNRRTLLAVAASLSLYEAGMALNDWADQEEDAVERPHRPLPSGRISPPVALGAAAALTAGGLALAAAAGRPALTVASGLAATVWAYDLGLKHTPAGPVAMAAARSLDLLLGAAATSAGVSTAGAARLVTRRDPAAGPVSTAGHGLRAAVPTALVLGAHTLAVTAVSRREAQGGSTVAPLCALAATAALTQLLARGGGESWGGGGRGGRGGRRTGKGVGTGNAVHDHAGPGTATGTGGFRGAGPFQLPADRRTAAASGLPGSTSGGPTPTPDGPAGFTPGSTSGSAPVSATGSGGFSGAGPSQLPADRRTAAASGLPGSTSGQPTPTSDGPAGFTSGSATGVTAGVAAVLTPGRFRHAGGTPGAALKWTGSTRRIGVRGAVQAALAATYAVTAARPFFHAALNPSPQLTQRAVGGGIRAMIPLQAALSARTGALGPALLTAALAPAARKFGRKVSVT